MSEAISNTSPLLYLYRLGVVEWLQPLFNRVWVSRSVEAELNEGRRKGYPVPDLGDYSWIQIVEPASMPSEWLALDLGPGELVTLVLALENSHHIVFLDDALARRIAQAAGLTVWGTLRVLLEAKERGLVDKLAPLVDKLALTGMWLSEDVRRRILRLAGED